MPSDAWAPGHSRSSQPPAACAKDELGADGSAASSIPPVSKASRRNGICGMRATRQFWVPAGAAVSWCQGSACSERSCCRQLCGTEHLMLVVGLPARHSTADAARGHDSLALAAPSPGPGGANAVGLHQAAPHMAWQAATLGPRLQRTGGAAAGVARSPGTPRALPTCGTSGALRPGRMEAPAMRASRPNRGAVRLSGSSARGLWRGHAAQGSLAASLAPPPSPLPERTGPPRLRPRHLGHPAAPVSPACARSTPHYPAAWHPQARQGQA